MPILKHAKKKLKQDKKRTERNKLVKVAFKKAVKKARETKTPKSLSEAFKAIDKAAKANIFHKNRAARIKSSLSKLVGKSAPVAKKTVPVTKTEKAKPVSKTKTAKIKTPTKKKASPKKSK